MLNFFKKKEEPFKVVACANGKCINIADVNDQVFSTKMMGDGFAIVPTTDVIVSPVTGTVETVFPTKHALGIKTNDNIEIIVHIGLDTVNLNGEGFTTLVKAKDRVKAGQPIVKFDKNKLEEKGYDLTTIVVFVGGYDKVVNLSCYEQNVNAGEILIS